MYSPYFVTVILLSTVYIDMRRDKIIGAGIVAKKFNLNAAMSVS